MQMPWYSEKGRCLSGLMQIYGFWMNISVTTMPEEL